MLFRRAPWGVALVLALLPSVLAGPAIAEPSREDRAAALALFDDGRKLAGSKKYAEACPKFEASLRLDPGLGTLLNLSDCYEQIGRTASAWSGFRDAASQARATNQTDREKVARERAAALESKLSRVRIVVPAELAGAALTITRDGSPLPASLVGTPIPVDPGTHTIRVAAEGKEPWETTVDVPANGKTVDVKVPVPASKPGTPAGTATAPAATTTAPAATSAAPAATAPTATSTAPAPTPSSAPDTASPRPWQKPLGIAATVTGVVGVGVGVAVGFLGKSTYDKSNESLCTAGTTKCTTQEGVDMRNEALAQGNIGTAVLIAGAVVGAAGVVLWITAPSAPAAPAKGATSTKPVAGLSDVRVGATPGGMVVRGQF
jgi:hypothetical protein